MCPHQGQTLAPDRLEDLRVFKTWSELFSIGGCCHDACVHGIVLALFGRNTPLHLKGLELQEDQR